MSLELVRLRLLRGGDRNLGFWLHYWARDAWEGSARVGCVAIAFARVLDFGQLGPIYCELSVECVARIAQNSCQAARFFSELSNPLFVLSVLVTSVYFDDCGRIANAAETTLGCDAFLLEEEVLGIN